VDERLRQDAESFVQLFESATEGIIIHRDEQLLAANQQLVEMLGYERFEDLPTSARDIVPAQEQLQIDVYVEQRHDQPYETRFYRADGQMLEVEVAPRVIDFRGAPARVVFARDITGRKRAEARLVQQQKLLSLLNNVATAANESSSVAQSFPLILKEICAYMNWPVGHAYLYHTGSETLEDSGAWYIADEARFCAFRDMTKLGTLAVGARLAAHTVQTGEPLWLDEIADDPAFVRRAAAQAAGLQTALFLPVQADQKIVGVLEFFTDATAQRNSETIDTLLQVAMLVGRVVERDLGKRELNRRIAQLEEAQAELGYRALHDDLTGLPNRTLLLNRIGRARAHAQSKNLLLALFFLDLDDFKSVNDSLGHAAGDRLLAAIAERLRMLIRQEDTVARLGGDEFVILLGGVRSPEEAAQIAQKILSGFQQPFHVAGQHVWARTSIGIACGQAGSVDFEDLLRNADAAMYRAKSDGRARYEFFDVPAQLPVANQIGDTHPLVSSK
jgi:diguanylate cyclase (GGDEF)-like protein/PAS domain S-box-containing protein